MTLREIAHLLRPLRTAIANTITRGKLKLLDDSKTFQSAQLELLEEEIRADVERMQEYGFTSVPLTGAQAVVAFIGGRRDHGVVIKCDDRRYRVVGLQEGEVCIYTDEGDKITLKRGNNIVVDCATKVQINCPLVETSADLHVLGKLEVAGTSALKGATTVGTGPAHANLTVNGEATANGKNLSTHTHGAGTYSITEVGAGGSVDTVTGSSGAPS